MTKLDSEQHFRSMLDFRTLRVRAEASIGNTKSASTFDPAVLNPTKCECADSVRIWYVMVHFWLGHGPYQNHNNC